MKKASLKLLKYISITLLIITILVSVTATTIIYFFPKEKLLEIVINTSRDTLKRKLAIEDLSYGFGGIVLKKVAIHNGLSEKDPVISKIDKIDLGIDLFALLQKEIDINKIYLDGFRINIIYNDEGVSNLESLIKEIIGEEDKEEEKSDLSTKIAFIKFTNSILTLKNPPKSLKPLEGTYNFNTTLKFDKNNNILVSKCKLNLPSKRGLLYPDLKIILKKGFVIIGNVKLDNTALPWVYLWGDNLTVPYNRVTGDVNNLKITKEFVEGDVKVTSTLLNSKNILHADGYTKVSIKNRTVYLGNVKGKVNTSTFLLNNVFFTFDGNLIKFKASKIDSFIYDVKPLLNFATLPDDLYGKFTGNLSNENSLYNGSLNFVNTGFDRKNKLISDLNLDLKITDNLFKKENVSLKINGYPCSLSVASIDKSFNNIFINIVSKKVKFNFDPRATGGTKNMIKLPVNLTGQLNIKEFIYDNQTISDVQVNYTFNNNILNVNRFSSGLLGGQIIGSGEITLGKAVPTADISVNFQNIKVQDYTDQTKKFKERFFGVASGKSKLKFKLSSKLADSLVGNVEFNIAQGKLVNTGIQNGLGIFLAELKYKLRDLEFTTIYGNLDIKNNIFQVNSFIFKSDDIRLNMKGTFDNKLIANPLHVNLEFTKYLTQDLAKPAVKLKLGKYEKGQWYIIPFIIKGDFTNSKSIKML